MVSVRDPLYGYLELSDEEKRVLDSPQMQRLRRIRQTSLSSLVYPGATHSRFTHSLGVMHIAGRMAESMGLGEEGIREVRLAGLMHDSGHSPFSHTSEKVAENYGTSHEDLSKQVIDDLENLYSADSDRLKRMIEGGTELGSVVAGEVDADRMDYLRRDAHNSGLEHGKIDYSTVIRFAEYQDGGVCFDQKAVQALESLLMARFHMIRSFYTHHASRIAESMLERALRALADDIGIDGLMSMDDRQAHSRLMSMEGGDAELYRKATSRKLYKRALVIDESDVTKDKLRQLSTIDEHSIENKISDIAEVKSGSVLVESPTLPKRKQSDARVLTGSSTTQLSELSPVPRSLEQAEWRLAELNIYAPDKLRDQVGDASKDVLENVLQY
jgi:HD superfamily phosphohydrolases